MSRREHRLLRTAGALAAAMGLALIASVMLAVLLLRFSGGVSEAAQTLQALRPWMIPAQLSILGLLWLQWPRLANLLARWYAMSDRTRDALIADRKRIFLMLALFEVVLVLRSLGSLGA